MKLNRVVPMLWVSDIEETIYFPMEELNDRVPVVYPIENFSYGMRAFAIRDNGYILQFGRPIE